MQNMPSCSDVSLFLLSITRVTLRGTPLSYLPLCLNKCIIAIILDHLISKTSNNTHSHQLSNTNHILATVLRAHVHVYTHKCTFMCKYVCIYTQTHSWIYKQLRFSYNPGYKSQKKERFKSGLKN